MQNRRGKQGGTFLTDYWVTLKVKVKDIDLNSYFYEEPEHYLFDTGLLEKAVVTNIDRIKDGI